MSRLNNVRHPLLNDEIVKLLNNHKIYNEFDFLNAKLPALRTITKLSFRELTSVKLKFLTTCFPTSNGLQLLLTTERKLVTLSSGITRLDVLLDGGFSNNKVYELCGLPSSGKTLLCLHIIKHYLKQFANVVYYIDTKRDFNARKLREMISSEESDDDVIGERLTRVFVKRCNSKFDVINSLANIKKDIDNNGIETHLIIIDSLPAVFYTSMNYKRDCELDENIIHLMKLLCCNNHVAFIVTNAISKMVSFSENAEKIEGPKIWARQSDVQLKIEKDHNFKISLTRNTDALSKNLNKHCNIEI